MKVLINEFIENDRVIEVIGFEDNTKYYLFDYPNRTPDKTYTKDIRLLNADDAMPMDLAPRWCAWNLDGENAIVRILFYDDNERCTAIRSYPMTVTEMVQFLGYQVALNSTSITAEWDYQPR